MKSDLKDGKTEMIGSKTDLESTTKPDLLTSISDLLANKLDLKDS